MAGPCTCRSPCHNSRPVGKDELAGVAPTEGIGTPTPTPVVLPAPTLTPATTPAVALSSDNELFKQFMKAYLQAQMPAQIAPETDSEPCKQLLKARFPDLYYGNLHMDCYQFCQQCKDHFETFGAKRSNRIAFAALFLRELVTQQ